MSGELSHRVASTDPRLLVPSGSSAPDRLVLVDHWQFPASGPPLILALTRDPENRWHVLPLVDEAQGLRRAREGDGWAAAAVELFVAGESEEADAGFVLRREGAAKAPDLGGYVSELRTEASSVHEVVLVGDAVRVRLDLLPAESHLEAFDAVAHLREVGFESVAKSGGDLVWRGQDQWVAPILGVGEPVPGMPLDEAFGRACTRHLRGGHDPEPTLALTRGLARLVATLHLALATSSALRSEPIHRVTEQDAATMLRTARDAVSVAVTLTDEDTQQHVRSRRNSVRMAFQPLADSEGSALLPAAPFTSLQQALVSEDDEESPVLDPLQLTTAAPPRPAVADVAALLRSLNHVAHGALRRMVGGGESVPVERVETWSSAVRELLLQEYLATLAAAGRSELFDERLLLGLEIQAECLALTYAARTLSTWSTVPNAGILELLPPD